MTSPQQPQRFFGLSGKGLVIIVLVIAFMCLGIGALALVVSSLASTVTTVLNQPTDTPEPTRRPPTATPFPTATSLPTETPTPTPTATPQPGQSRSHPLSSNTSAQSGDWEVQVLEFKRGAEAAQLIREANQFNAPAPDGQEYLLLKARAKSLPANGQAQRITGGDFKLTGDRLTRYLPVAIVPPDPQLEAELFPGGETAGWIVYAIGSGEDRLIAEFDPLSNTKAPSVFLALQPGAAIDVDPTLREIVPTELGRQHEEPAHLGAALTTDDWQVQVLEVIRGPQVFDTVKAANQFNDPPAAGMEYLAARVRVKNLHMEDHFTMIDSGSFKTLGARNVLYNAPAVVEPEPALDAYLYPGGEAEGWVILQIGQGEGDAQIVFDPLFDTTHVNRRYIAAE